MTSAIFGRLMWKEFRVQRSLWFALLAATLLLQILVSQLWMGPASEVWPGLVSLGVGLGWFYALGSGAVSFAAEREDDTQIRMVAMACPPAVTVSAKVVYGAITTLFFLLVSTAFATWLRPPSLAILEGAQQIVLIETSILAIVSLWFALLVAVGCSLMAQRVLLALLMAGIVTSVLETILFSVTLGQASSIHDAWRAMQWGVAIKVFAIGILCLLAYGLARRWLNRDFPVGTLSRRRFWFPSIRVVRIRADGTIVVPVDLGDSECGPVPSIKEALQTPPPRRLRWWSGWLLGSRHRHEWRFLVWHELVGTRFWFFLMLSLVWLCTLPAMFRTPNGPLVREWVFGPGILFSVIAAWACGFMTFRQEQTQRQFLFATHHGVSPFTVWAAKQIAWSWRFCLAFVVINSVPLLSRPLEFFTELIQVMGISLPFHELVKAPPHATRPLVNLYFTDFFRVPSALLTFYAIGQAASLVIRRTVLAWFVAAISSVALFIWLSVLFGLRVNPLTSTVPISASLFFVTLLYCRPWMMERSSRWLTAKLVSVVMLGLMGTAGLVSAYRIHEIPVGEIPSERAAHYGSWHDSRPVRASVDHQRTELLKPITTSEEQNGAELLRLCEQLQQTWTAAGVKATDADVLNGVEQVQLEAVAPLLDQLVSLAARAAFAFGHPESLHVDDPRALRVSKLTTVAIDLLRQSAERDIAVGHNEQALTKLSAALSLAAHVEHRGNVILNQTAPGGRPIETITPTNSYMQRFSSARFQPRHLGSRSVGTVLEQLIRWAGHPQTTTAMIDRALTVLSEHRRNMVTPEAWLIAKMAFHRATLERGLDLEVENQFKQHGVDNFEITFERFAARLPGEHARALRYLDWFEANEALFNNEWGLARNSQGYGGRINFIPAKEILYAQQIAYVASTTPIVRFLHSTHLDLLRYEYSERDSNLKATIIALALIAEYRGQPAPRELTLKRDLGFDLTDPWTNRPFDWWPDGFPETMTGANWIQGGYSTIPAGTPLLLSPGQGRLRWGLQQVLHIPEEQTAAGTMGGPPGMMPPDALHPGNVPGTFKGEYALSYAAEDRHTFLSLPLRIHLPRDAFAPRPADTEPAWRSRIGTSPEFVSP